MGKDPVEATVEGCEYVHVLMQTSVSSHHQDYDKICRDHGAVEQQAESKDRVSVVASVDQFLEVEIK